MARFRQILVFERFLARVFAEFGDRVIVKGGVVLEFRLARARTTRDVDLRLVGSPDDLLGRLQAAGRRDLGDYLIFAIEIDREHPTIEITQAVRRSFGVMRMQKPGRSSSNSSRRPAVGGCVASSERTIILTVDIDVNLNQTSASHRGVAPG
jgi:hypothetical protein